jgi:integrase
MARVKLAYVNSFVDRHGRVRYYFRRRGHRNVRLPGLPGSPEFMRAYEAAIDRAEPIIIGASRAKAGTVAATVGLYLASSEFAGLADETRRTRRNILERFREAHGDKRIAAIERKHVQALVDAKAATPSAARNLLAVIRLLMRFAIDAGIRADDPTLGVKRVKIKTDGYATWTEDDIAAFERRHPLGTMPRLALALLLGTGQRRSDVVRMGRQHMRGEWITVRQSKTGKPLTIPIGDELLAAIEAMPSDRLTFLTTARGLPFTAAGFTNYFRKQCREAGLAVGLSGHGLRKTMCRRLAEAGCSANEIAAISGHATLHEVERYTKAADQQRMAGAAFKRLKNDRATNREEPIYKAQPNLLKLQGGKLEMVGATRTLDPLIKRRRDTIEFAVLFSQPTAKCRL